jgi:hypothetical protein
MDKADELDYENDDMPAEIDFSNAERGRYAERFAKGTNLVPLAPDVMESFPDAESVNNALRLMAQVAQRTARIERAR